jgi:hypothetical protein
MIYPLLKAIGSDYSIGVVTYVKRFETYFKPLVLSLEKYFPGVEKNYVLNGFYDQTIQAEYLNNAKQFLKGTSASNVVAYNESQSLCRAWNQLILHSSKPKILILNDDLIIGPLFRSFFELQMWPFDFRVINKTWSISLFSKNIIRKVGFMEERFPAMGSEDLDYCLRLYKAWGRKEMPGHAEDTIYCPSIKNIVAKNEDPGWSKISETIKHKTAVVNEEFFKTKWEVSEKPMIDSIFAFNKVYYRIRPGMETPNFYDFSLLDNPLKSPI